MLRGEAECRDRQISENDPKKGTCAPALLSAQCLPMLLHEERAGPCLVPSNRTLHYWNTGIVADPCSAPPRRVRNHMGDCDGTVIGDIGKPMVEPGIDILFSN